MIIKRIISKIKREYELKKKRARLARKMHEFFENLEQEENPWIIKGDIADWRDTLLLTLRDADYFGAYYFGDKWRGFAEQPLKLIKKADSSYKEGEVTLVCSLHNGRVYLEEFFRHYRNIGIKRFLIIDNRSEDGSREFLSEQPDVTLYECSYDFLRDTKAGWNMQAIAREGINRWYLWVDCDEFLAFPGMEDMNLTEYCKKIYNMGIREVYGFMLDMYPDFPLMDRDHDVRNFIKDYVYFDSDISSYIVDSNGIHGGVRQRLLGLENVLRMDKVPLVYAQKKHININSHEMYPKKKNRRYGCVLKHYKFLPEDNFVYSNRAKDPLHDGHLNDEAQKKYITLDGMVAYNEKSVRYEDSRSLFMIPFLENYLTKKTKV